MTTTDRSDRRDYRARLLFWILSAAGAASLVWRGRPRWFTFDDWTLLVTRRRVWETEGLLDFLLLPHNEHLLPGLTLWDIGLASIFGIDSYLPWTLSIVAALVFIAVVLRRAMHDIGVPSMVAAASAPVVMVWPDFAGALSWAPETVFILYLALGVAHLLLVLGDHVDDRRAALGALLSTLAILFHSGAALTTGVIVLVLVASRRWRAATWSALPLLGYGLWFLTWGQKPEVFSETLRRFTDPVQVSADSDKFQFVRIIAGQGFRFLMPVGGWFVWVAIVACGAFLAVRRWGTTTGRVVSALTGSSILAVAAITVSRSRVGAFADTNPQSRYAVLVVVPLLPLIALELWLAATGLRALLSRTRLGGAWTTRLSTATITVCLAALVIAGILATERDTQAVTTSRSVRRVMSAIVSTPSTRETRPDIALIQVLFDLDVGGVWSLVDWGWFSPDRITDPEVLLIPQVRFLVAGGLRRSTDDPVALRLSDTIDRHARGDGCVVLSPLAEPNRVFLVRGSGPSYMAVPEGARNIELRAQRDGVRSEWFRLSGDPTTADFRILSDPDVDLVIRLLGPATFCDTAALP
jgi:hypothetical protein